MTTPNPRWRTVPKLRQEYPRRQGEFLVQDLRIRLRDEAVRHRDGTLSRRKARYHFTIGVPLQKRLGWTTQNFIAVHYDLESRSILLTKGDPEDANSYSLRPSSKQSGPRPGYFEIRVDTLDGVAPDLNRLLLAILSAQDKIWHPDITIAHDGIVFTLDPRLIAREDNSPSGFRKVRMIHRGRS